MMLEILAAVQNRIEEVMPNRRPAFFVGAEGLDVDADPPQVFFVPNRAALTGAIAQGGEDINAVGVRNPRMLAVRRLVIDAYVWETDFAACEVILQHLYAALQQVCAGSWRPISENWNPGQLRADDEGVLVVASFDVGFPLTREIDRTAVVTAIPITAADHGAP